MVDRLNQCYHFPAYNILRQLPLARGDRAQQNELRGLQELEHGQIGPLHDTILTICQVTPIFFFISSKFCKKNIQSRKYWIFIIGI